MIRFIVILFIISSCNSKYQNQYIDIVNQADSIYIVYTSGVYKDTTIELSTELKKDFKSVFEGKDEKCSCASTGRIRFYSKNDIILVADFSIDKVNNINGEDCVFLSVFPSDHGCYRLNYNTGMFLSETYADLKRSK